MKDKHNTYAATALGPDMLLRALVRVGISPKELSMLVAELSFQGFNVFTSKPILLQVLKNTEYLRLYIQPKGRD